MSRGFLAVFLAVAVVTLPAPASLNSNSVLTEARRVADWQLAQIGDADQLASLKNNDRSLRGWVMGAFDVGLSALADKDPKYAEIIYAQGRRQGWQLGGRQFHADDHVIAQTWIWAYERRHDPVMIAAVRRTFDAVIAASPDVPLDFVSDSETSCQVRWC